MYLNTNTKYCILYLYLNAMNEIPICILNYKYIPSLAGIDSDKKSSFLPSVKRVRFLSISNENLAEIQVKIFHSWNFLREVTAVHRRKNSISAKSDFIFFILFLSLSLSS